MTQNRNWEFIDGLITEAVEGRRFPGAVLTVIEDGAVTLSRGYGHSDMEAGSMVDSARTIFRISSVSGLLTAMAVLKLVEDGEVKLDDEAVKYVPELETASDQHKPLRLINLISHSDGLQECLLDTASIWPDNRLSLKEFISRHAPSAIGEPGESITFGNMSMVISGCIIENVSGVTYSEYINKMILEPLGMYNTFNIPDLRLQNTDVAAPYGFDNGVLVRLPDIISNIPPADGILSTGKDMGLLLTFLMRGGDLRRKGVIGPGSVEKIMSSGVSPVAGLPGVTCGFFECPVAGGTALIRKGEGPGTSCIICILPGQDTGFFFAANKSDGKIHDELIEIIVENLGKEIRRKHDGELCTYSGMSSYPGDYHYVQHGRNTIAKYMSLSRGLIRIEQDDEDKNSLKTIPLGQGDLLGGFKKTEVWVRREGDLFEEKSGRLIAFKRDESGRPDELCSAQGFHGCYRRVRRYDSADFYSALAGLFLVIFLLSAVASPALIFTGTGYAVLLAVLMGITALSDFLFLISVQSTVQSTGSIDGHSSLCFSDSRNTLLMALLAFPLLTAAMTVAILVFTAMSWSSPLSTSQKVIYPLFSFMSLMFILFLNRLKLFGYRF